MAGFEAPSAPGVYYLLDRDRRILYVGKAANLRRRLGDHARSARWSAVAACCWETLDSDAAALAREADLLAALRPLWNRTVDGYFSGVTIGRNGLVLGARGDYGCFPHLGRGAMTPPGRACIDGFDALNRIVRTTRPERRLLELFLAGRSDALLRTPLEIDQPHIAHGVRRDRLQASGFYHAGPRALRALRLRHGGSGLVSREQFARWITDEVRTVVEHPHVLRTGPG
jgi:predicted GIY-YIG superfamily endonuclease